jgi:AraC-like DNA-binding protein
MINWLIPPKSQVIAKYIECYWYLEKSSDAVGDAHPKLNPDPSAHLILFSPKQSYRYDDDDKVHRGQGCHWLYPHGKTLTLDHSSAFSCIGVKFKVGALYSLANINFIHALVDTADEMDFDNVRGVVSISEDELLSKAKSGPEHCCEILDNLLLPWFENCHEDKHSEITRQILPLLAEHGINTLAATLSCSQRTLERSFLKVTGFTLKQCQSMDKLEAILAFLYQRQQSDIDWADIAFQFGFSDQPHLIRYLKQQINLTPQNYAQQRGFTIDVYGGVEAR